MSFIDGISGAVGLRPTAGGSDRPTLGTGTTSAGSSAAQGLSSRFGTVFGSTFNTNMATVYERGAKGEFDDPTLALQEQAALQRLRIAQQAAGAPTSSGTPPTTPEAQVAPSNSTGADAAPEAAPATHDPQSYARPSTAGPSAATPASTNVAVAEQREVYTVRVRQSEARLSNISRSLANEFPLAAQLTSASSGTWDPATFRPRTKEEAEALAQRMVIDATEAAARLEIVTTQRDAANFAAQTTGSPEATALVVKLDAELGRQRAYTDKLARIVDDASGGAMRTAGREAMAGATLRDSGDIPIAELAAALAGSGADAETIERLVGATELGVEEERTPGGSVRIRQIVGATTDHYVAMCRQMTESLRTSSEKDREQWDRQDRALAEQRTQERQDERRDAAEAQSDARAQQVRATRQAEYEQWLQELVAVSQQRSQAS